MSINKYNQYFKGKILNNKYLLFYKIGHGSFATVWLSLNLITSKFYAIKIQKSKYFDSAIIEVKILNMLTNNKCTYISHMIEHFIYNSNVCMVFELFAGSIYDIMKYIKYIPYNVIKIIIYQLLIAMDIINNQYNILHTDIKPENILVYGLNNKIIDIINIIQKNKKLKITIDKLNNNISRKNKKQFQTIVNNLSLDKITKKYNNKSINFINKKLLDDIHICLSDFGNCKDINNLNYDIQTRYYRAPEIILKYKYESSACDMWSIGCLIYEMITGKLLFNPDKQKGFSRDKYHIQDMIILLGNIPKSLLDDSENKYIFFKKNGLLKGGNEILFNPLYFKLYNELSKHNISNNEILLTIDFIYKLLNYDPFIRPSPKTALTHKWFNNLNL